MRVDKVSATPFLAGDPVNIACSTLSQRTIEQKIHTARSIWTLHGDALMADEQVNTAIVKLKKAIEQSWLLMRELKVVDGCGICATTKPGGGCCGAGIEDWYDEYVLLMNLMMGRNIPEAREEETGCLFLGPTGCKLMARFHFCINYLCPDIRERLSAPKMQKLTAQNGREIYCGWQLENIIRERLVEWDG